MMTNRISTIRGGIVPGPIRSVEDFPPALQESPLRSTEYLSTPDLEIILGQVYDFAGERVRILNLLAKQDVDVEADFLLGMVAFQFISSGLSQVLSSRKS